MFGYRVINLHIISLSYLHQHYWLVQATSAAKAVALPVQPGVFPVGITFDFFPQIPVQYVSVGNVKVYKVVLICFEICEMNIILRQQKSLWYFIQTEGVYTVIYNR